MIHTQMVANRQGIWARFAYRADNGFARLYEYLPPSATPWPSLHLSSSSTGFDCSWWWLVNASCNLFGQTYIREASHGSTFMSLIITGRLFACNPNMFGFHNDLEAAKKRNALLLGYSSITTYIRARRPIVCPRFLVLYC